MADPVRVRQLSDQEGQRLQRIVRRGTGSAVRLRRAMVVPASAGGNSVPVIARLVHADEDSVRQVIHRFNEMGMASLDPRWAGGRPRITPDDEAFIVATAYTRPTKLGRPFTCWSLRKLAEFLAANPARIVQVGRERLRQLLHKHQISFQHTKTWKESTDPDREAKLARIEDVIEQFRTGCSRSTSSAHWRSAHTMAPAGYPRPSRRGCRRTTTSSMASGTSTAATR
ncbi:helix-turn-helix domain-containing protein [Actinopolymorpha rutila]|uniref:helix-turn-helix domain-containing protein n=1 Tax=Actinopolymorpha rutila TaxID=446787 RepID=UPI0031E24813